MGSYEDYEDENYDDSQNEDFETDNDYIPPDNYQRFITSEGNYNDVILKAQAKDIAAIRTLENDIKKAPFFQTTKNSLILKVRTYTDPTNVLAILQTTKDAMRHFEIDITATISDFQPHDIEQPEMHNIIRSLRHLYEMYLTRAINGLERDKQGVIEHRSQNRFVMEKKNPFQTQAPKKRFFQFRGSR